MLERLEIKETGHTCHRNWNHFTDCWAVSGPWNLIAKNVRALQAPVTRKLNMFVSFKSAQSCTRSHELNSFVCAICGDTHYAGLTWPESTKLELNWSRLVWWRQWGSILISIPAGAWPWYRQARQNRAKRPTARNPCEPDCHTANVQNKKCCYWYW